MQPYGAYASCRAFLLALKSPRSGGQPLPGKGKHMKSLSAVVISAALALATTASASPLSPWDLLKQQVKAARHPTGTVAQGRARALAWVNGDGSLQLSKAIVRVGHNQLGIYCLQLRAGIDATTAIPIVSADYMSSEGSSLFATVVPSSTCSTFYDVTNAVGVATGTTNSGHFELADVAFTLVVP